MYCIFTCGIIILVLPLLVLCVRFTIAFFFVQSNYPLLSRLSESYKQVPAIRNALPENQPDFPKELKGIILIRIY
ncbi:putative glutathione transferase [Helianthus annuus]|nr:putative glutathione transferase [Helianthus annuus]